MAASGIAEHNEARRREMVYLRKAYIQQELKNHEESQRVKQEASSAHQHQHQHHYGPGPKMDAQSVDAQRRMEHYRNTQLEYSAKIPNRYTSINYMSQW